MMGRWYEGFLGLRYLRASPKRGFVSLIAGIAILGLALGVAVLIVVLSVMNGFEGELRTRILSVTAHATITGLDGSISNWRADLATLEKVPGVAAASPYIEEQALMAHQGKSSGVMLRGVLPDEERRVANLGRHLESGSLTDLVPGSYRAILGKALAETLGVRVGDRVIIMVPEGDVTPLGVMPRMRAFRVDGILSVGMYEYDRRVAIVALEDAATLLRLGESVTGLRLAVDNPYEAPRVVRDAAIALPKGAQDYLRERLDRGARQFLSLDRDHQAHAVRDPLAGGGGRGLQHRVHDGHGGEGQAARHRHLAHIRLLVPEHPVGVHRPGKLDRRARYRGWSAWSGCWSPSICSNGARARARARVQVPGCAGSTS